MTGYFQVDSSTPYALTGSIFARDRIALNIADRLLQNAAGNFYVNDKVVFKQ
jgi:1-pyrroline-5-carboxylate dehydrogenase